MCVHTLGLTSLADPYQSGFIAQQFLFRKGEEQVCVSVCHRGGGDGRMLPLRLPCVDSLTAFYFILSPVSLALHLSDLFLSPLSFWYKNNEHKVDHHIINSRQVKTNHKHSNFVFNYCKSLLKALISR